MKEYSGYLGAVDLMGPNGSAVIEVRCHVPIAEARKLARWMTVTGHPLRVLVPDEPSVGNTNDSQRQSKEGGMK